MIARIVTTTSRLVDRACAASRRLDTAVSAAEIGAARAMQMHRHRHHRAGPVTGPYQLWMGGAIGAQTAVCRCGDTRTVDTWISARDLRLALRGRPGGRVKPAPPAGRGAASCRSTP